MKAIIPVAVVPPPCESTPSRVTVIDDGDPPTWAHQRPLRRTGAEEPDQTNEFVSSHVREPPVGTNRGGTRVPCAVWYATHSSAFAVGVNEPEMYWFASVDELIVANRVAAMAMGQQQP
jgi:hypothetical protein